MATKKRKSMQWLMELPAKILWTPYDYYKILRSARGKTFGEYRQAELLTPDPNLAREMRLLDDVDFTHDTDGDGVIVRYGDVRCRIRERCDLTTAREIFVRGSYRVLPAKDCVVVDVGANVGIASLYFARLPQVKAVIGFEPFKPTFDRIWDNLALNPHLAPKITVHNLGISNRNEEMEVDYCPGLSIVSGVSGPIEKTDGMALVRERISIKPASDVIKPILGQYPNVDLVLKLDCEGSEYDILEDLDKNDLIGSVSMFLMEWHKRGPEPIIKRLEGHGFTVLLPGLTSRNNMMLYAFKQA